MEWPPLCRADQEFNARNVGFSFSKTMERKMCGLLKTLKFCAKLSLNINLIALELMPMKKLSHVLGAK
jgi:hypothetical protein